MTVYFLSRFASLCLFLFESLIILFLRSTQRGLLRGLYDTIAFCYISVRFMSHHTPLFLFRLSFLSFLRAFSHLMNKVLHDSCVFPNIYYLKLKIFYIVFSIATCRDKNV